MAVLHRLKQSRSVRPPRDVDPGLVRPPNLRYVYSLTAFVSLGGFLFGWNQGVMGMIIADARWLSLMRPSSDWSIGFVVSVYNITSAIGALAAGYLADICGRERTLSMASVLTALGALVQTFAYSLTQMTVGRFIIGLGIGAYAAGVPLYISEISPADLRGRIVGINLMILCFAEMVVFLVDYGCFFLQTDDWWRIPVFLQVFPAALLALGCWRSSWVPPSPRWLVSEGRHDCALEVLTRLHGTVAADEEMSEIKEAVSVEQSAGALTSQPKWGDMFRGPILRVTLLGVGIQFFQQITGTNAIFYYTPLLFKNGGITDPKIANLATAGVGLVLFLSAWIPIFFFDRLDRKTWLQVGLVGMFIALLGIAFLQRHAESHPGDPKNYAIITFPFLFFTSFNMSWSSGSWTYAAEIFPNSLRVSACFVATRITSRPNSVVPMERERCPSTFHRIFLLLFYWPSAA